VVPEQVQNLRSIPHTSAATLTLSWDKPSNVKTAEEVTAYDICFRPARSYWKRGYHKMTVDSSATSVVLTRENGLNPRTRYEFEVRARNDHCEGEWSNVSIQPKVNFLSGTFSLLLGKIISIFILFKCSV